MLPEGHGAKTLCNGGDRRLRSRGCKTGRTGRGDNGFMTEARYAAVFVDYENVYYHLKNNFNLGLEVNDYVLDIIRNLRTMTNTERGQQCIVLHAYGDFERLSGTPQGSLYLMGVESHNVLGTEHKNAADMKLCIDAMDLLYTRPEINTFIFLAGDRDYIPLMQHLRQKAKSILAVAFRGNVSGDLLQVIGDENFIDAEGLITEALRKALVERKPTEAKESETVKPPANLPQVRPAPPITPPIFTLAKSVKNEDDRRALTILLQNFGTYSEVFLSPFLWKLRGEMQDLADYQRKALITNLEMLGAVRVEKRQGEPNDYSVIIINWDHPDVREINPG
jgi:NYN domain